MRIVSSMKPPKTVDYAPPRDLASRGTASRPKSAVLSGCEAIDAAREMEQWKPSRPEMLSRLAWQVLRERGLLKIPGE